MPGDQERRRKKLRQKAAKRKEHKRALARSEAVVAAPSSQRGLARAAAHWPLDECWISRDWQEEGALVQAVVARRSPLGQIAAAVFLVDLGLLGVKDAFVQGPSDNVRKIIAQLERTVGAENYQYVVRAAPLDIALCRQDESDSDW